MADILMYHGIDDVAGPTSVPPQVFADQMSALAASGRTVLSMDDWIASRDPEAVVITFDDALTSFAEAAWPVLKHHGFPAMVYVATGHVGGHDGWDGGAGRPILPWSELQALARDGVDFGGHSVSHPHLTRLSPADLSIEVTGCKTELEHRLGQKVRHFAPPYGASNDQVRDSIARHWDSAVGTRLAQAENRGNCYDLPRLEMLYFKDIARWKAHLAGRGGAYLALRRVLRGVRQGIVG